MRPSPFLVRASFVLALTLPPLAPSSVRGQEALSVPEVVVPHDVLPDEETFVYVYGRGFSARTRIVIDGVGDLQRPSLHSGGLISGWAPPLPGGVTAGWKSVRAINGDGSPFVLPEAILYVDFGAPYLKYASPTEVAPEGGAIVRFYGRNLRADLTPTLEGRACTDVRLEDAETIAARVPALEPRPAGQFYSADLRQPGGEIASARDGVLAVIEGSRPAIVTSVEPAELDARGGFVIDIHGENFRPFGPFDATRIIFGLPVFGEGDDPDPSDPDYWGYDVAAELVNAQWISPNLIRGLAPSVLPYEPDPRIPWAVAAVDARGQRILPRAVHFVDRIRSVSPSRISSAGGDVVTFEGSGFQPGFGMAIGDVPLEEVEWVSPEVLRGVAPPLPAGTWAAHILDEDAIIGTLPNAIEVVDADGVFVPGPADVETSLARGTAVFAWHNPLPYDSLAVFDSAGRRLATLDGAATSFELPTGGLDLVGIRVEARVAGIFQPGVTDMVARRPDCAAIRPLLGAGLPANDKFDFTLYGGNRPAAIPRCVDGDVGAVQGLLDLSEIVAVARTGLARNGSPQPSGAIGSVTSRRITAEAFRLFGRPLTNRIVTGFVLERPADRLFVRAHYAKLDEAFGLRLKARIIRMFPEADFVDEFSLPDIAVTGRKEWNGITYYRAERDVLDVENAENEACGLQIPAGEYVLELFAEGGDANTPYFVVTSDNRSYELQIPGTPCPPYPLVEVSDVTGRRTLPDLTGVTALEVPVPPGTPPYAEFTAHGSWFDEAGRRRSIVPGEEGYLPGQFEFHWRIHDVEGGSDRAPTRDNPLRTWVRKIGCYQVDLTVVDTECGRRATRTFEVAVLPRTRPCEPGTRYFSITNGLPDITGLFAVVGLSPPPGRGRLQTNRSLEMRFLVTPPDDCGTSSLAGVSALEGDVEFRLVAETARGAQVVWGPSPLLDLCDARRAGPKYFLLRVDDLGRLPLLAGADGAFRRVDVQVHTRHMRDRANPLVGFDVDDPWRSVGSFRATNRPNSLESTYWNGFFDAREGRYHFITRATPDTVSTIGMPRTQRFTIPLPGLPAFDIPPLDNSLATGVVTDLTLGTDGVWTSGRLRSSTAGELLGNTIDGRPIEGDALPFRKGIADDIAWEWSKCETILENSFEEELFRAILFSGPIGPVPVTIWATVGLGIDVLLQASASAKLAPFAPLDGGHYFEGSVQFDSSLKVSLPASIRADVLFGVVSYIVSFIPSGGAEFKARIGAVDDRATAEYQFRIVLNLLVEMKLCVLYFFCDSRSFPIIRNHALVDVRDTEGGRDLTVETCDDGKERKENVEDQGIVLGAGGRDTHRIYFESYHPVAATGPDGTIIDVSSRADGRAIVRAIDPQGFVQTVGSLLGTTFSHPLLDPAITFLAADRAMISWTVSYPEESGIEPLPAEGAVVPTSVLNRLKAQDDIAVTLLVRDRGVWQLAEAVRVADLPDLVPVDDRRADGRSAAAGDVQRGEALVAWVRIDHEEFITEETIRTSILEPTTNPDGSPAYREVTIDAKRPRLEFTAIYSRLVDENAVPIGPAVRLSPPGINIEPSVAMSPSGDVAYCVWVHDPTHTDLIQTNRGRNLLYSVWSRATGDWSAPLAILPNGDAFPGVLEPAIALSGDGRGILGFTALPADAHPADAGHSNRYLFTARLEDGVFSEPLLLRGACREPVIGHWMQFSVPQTGTRFEDLLKYRNPEWVMSFQRSGNPLTEASRGGVALSVLDAGAEEFAPPVLLTSSANRYSNVATAISGARIHSLALNGGPATLELGAIGAVGGVVGDVEPFVETITATLDPDLAVESCRLTDPFSAPGAFITARIEIRNRGLAASAEAQDGTGASGVELVFVGADGSEEVVASAGLSVLGPNESAVVELDVEMPHVPVVLSCRLTGNPHDLDRANDRVDCFFGAPAPRDFACVVTPLDEEGATFAAHLTWNAQALYDEIVVYRDGQHVKCLPGATSEWVDPLLESGDHTYEIRGRIGASRSARVSADCSVTPPTGGIRRGDADASGRVDITDAIATLSYLFLGASPVACEDAADADDSGALDITDPIRILGFLFLGGAPPAAPGPATCAPDPTADGLACRAECGA